MKKPRLKTEPIKDFIHLAMTVGNKTDQTKENQSMQTAPAGNTPKGFIPPNVRSALKDWVARIDVNSTMEDNVINLMADQRPFTVDEVKDVFEAAGEDYAKVPALMLQMQQAGYFRQVRAGTELVFVIKEKLPNGDIVQKTPRLYRDQTGCRLAPNPMGVIKKDEGVDVAIYKVLADGIWRTAKEIRAMLYPYGFQAGPITNRLRALLFSAGWMDRRELHGGDTTYSVKKGKTLNDVIKVKKTNDSKVYSGEDPQLPEATLQLQKPIVLTPESSARASNHITPESKGIEVAPPVSAPIHSSDGIEQAIWKVVHDRKAYTTGDISLMLVDYGFNKKTIGMRVGGLFKDHGWFDRELGKSKFFIYTMREGIPYPDGVKFKYSTDVVKTEVKKEEPKAPAAPTPVITKPVEPSEPKITLTPTVSELATELSATGDEVRNAIMSLRMPMIGKMLRLTSESSNKIREFFSSRVALREIARELDVDLDRMVVYFRYRGFMGNHDSFAVGTQIEDIRQHFIAKKEEEKELTPTAPVVVAPVPQDKPSLLEISIKVKGVSFSTTELNDLTKDLKEVIEFSKKVKSVVPNIQLKGIELSIDEIVQLSEQLTALQLK